MSEVVQLDPARARRGGRPAGESKTALVLGGGGFTGGVYEIGALRALDLLAVNQTVNEFDVYVGTSAGAFIASMVSNGITPEEMMRVLNRELPATIRELNLGELLRPNVRGFAEKAAAFPFRMAGLALDMASNLRDLSAIEVAAGLANALPSGFYRSGGLERYVADVLSDPDRTNDFRMLDRDLFITATDLDTTERIVLGDGEWTDVPISKAVAASGALPMVYAPVEIEGREFVDGGIRSTTNIDVAVQHGAEFIIVVNPIVPFVNDFSKQIPTVFGKRARRVSDMGLAAIGNQAFRMLSHDRLHRAVNEWERMYPGVDVILIEPELDDELMFGTSIFDYSSRLEIAKHGFESVTLKLARDYDRYKEVAERHGIEISASRVRHVLDQVESEPDQVPAWRRVFEQTTSALLRQQQD
ncbi:MAG: patatin-like phospholipase family protein [Solirubrobacterales bacterium]